MSFHYLIDGYNVTRHELFRRYLDKEGDERSTLLKFIGKTKLARSMRNKITVVFDGLIPGAGFRTRANIDVIFSQEETADSWIVRRVMNDAHPRSLIVVSNDRELGFLVKNYGATVMTVEELLTVALLRTPLRETTEEDKKTPPPNEEKINEELEKLWLK